MLIKLNPSQKEAVKHESGPLLIVAGAGTGKTTVITERIKWLIEQKKALPHEILALTFTERAASEMQERVDEALPIGYLTTWISTIHSFCEKILRAEALQIGASYDFKILSEAEAALLVKQNLFKFNLKYFRPLGNPGKFIVGLIQHFSRLKDEDISASEYQEWTIKNQNYNLNLKTDEGLEKYEELSSAYGIYENLKAQENVMDFADLISNTLRLFRQRPHILKKYQDQFKYILVDEFQDTNFAQNELLILLAGEEQKIAVVFDDDQAIYRWRGAAVYNVLDFRRHYPNAKVIVLTENYRSNQLLLDYAYQLIQHNNPDRLEAKEGVDKRLKAVRERKAEGGRRKAEGQEVIRLIWEEKVEDETEKVALEINELISRNSKLETRNSKQTSNSKPQTPNDLNFKDIAILVRANNHAEPFARALKRHGIPYQFLGPSRLYFQDEIRDLIAYLKVLVNFEDNVAMYRVLNIPHLAFNPRDIAALLNFVKKYNFSLFEAAEKAVEYYQKRQRQTPIEGNYPWNLSSETYQKLEKLIGLIHHHLGLMPKEGPGQILYYFAKDSGVLEHFADPHTLDEQKKIENISKFFDKLKAFETQRPEAKVFDFVEYLDFVMTAGESPLVSEIDKREEDAVKILTVHSSKGLEFSVVFLVNLVEQRFPTRERREQIPIPDELVKETLPVGDPHLQEERRLFYVGMTRAKDLLYLTAAKFYADAKRPKKLSQFVYETLGLNLEVYLLKEEASPKPTLFDWIDQPSVSRPQPSILSPSISYLSHSQIQTFEICPLHYKLRYIIGLPTLQFAAASFGDSMHKALRAFYEKARADGSVNLDTLLLALEGNWNPVGYESKKHQEEMKKRGISALKKFFEESFDPKTKPIFLEQPFKLKVDKDLTLAGVIDRVDVLPGGKVEIIDYKTGAVFSQKEIDENLQMSIYAWAISEPAILGKPVEQQILSFYFFDEGRKVSTTRIPEQIEEAKQKILDWKKKIEESDFKCSGNIICQNCEYKLFCNH